MVVPMSLLHELAATDCTGDLEFDYVIIGAGASAAGLLFGVLSQHTDSDLPFSIALIEQGAGPPHAGATQNPNYWFSASHFPSSSASVFQTLIGSRVLDLPNGKGLGGTTNVNATLCIPPAADDFESWPHPWKDAMIPAIHKIQDSLIKNNAMLIGSLKDDDGFSPEQTWVEPTPDDIMRSTDFPSSYVGTPCAVRKAPGGSYQRVNYFDALVETLLKARQRTSKELTWIRETTAQRIIFDDDNRAIGVECEATKQLFVVKCRREVILCAGAFGSPALLMVSGVGSRQDLEDAGIEPHSSETSLNLGVGRNLHDHVQVPCALVSDAKPFCNISPGSVRILRNIRQEGNRFQYMLFDSALTGQIAPHFGASSFRHRFVGYLYQPLNFFLGSMFLFTRAILHVIINELMSTYLRTRTVAYNIILLNPKSRGRVKVQRKTGSKKDICRRADVDVVIESCYLTDEADIKSLQQAYELSKEHCKTWIKNGTEIMPGSRYRAGKADNTWFRGFCRSECLPYFHYCGTCSIQKEAKTAEEDISVVDSTLRVRNYHGLRVCDASVIPDIVAAPTALTSAALGYVFSSFLFKEPEPKKQS